MEESVLIYKVEVHFLYRCDKLKVEFEMEERVLIYRQKIKGGISDGRTCPYIEGRSLLPIYRKRLLF